jgi:hypothetical protein
MLLTTRSQIVGNVAARIEVEAMEPEEGLLFLLKRSGMLKDGSKSDTLPSDIQSTSSQLVELLRGHPLALDQAGAYIEETGDSFATYLQLYSDQRLILLNERGSLGGEHPETVVVTFEISFQQARERYPTAADVLHFCSFLHPDDIPEELFSQEDGLKLNVTMFNNAMKALRRYSLIKRNAEKKTLSVHHLVQAVLRDSMPAETQRQWMERAVHAIAAAFPDFKFANWPTFERLLPHALTCATWIEQALLTTPEASLLLNVAGYYLYARARYGEAEPLLMRALLIREQELGATHPILTHNLGYVLLHSPLAVKHPL